MTAKILTFDKVIKDLEKKKTAPSIGEFSMDNIYNQVLEMALYLRERMEEERETSMLESEYTRDQARIHSKA